MFRFTIRDLLWLMMVVGMAFAWHVDHALYESWEHKGIWLDIELRAAGWQVTYDDHGQPTLIPPSQDATASHPTTEPPPTPK